MKQKNDQDINRRTFVKNTAIGCVAAGMIAKDPQVADNQKEEMPKIQAYRTLGRTGFNVSDIGIGTVGVQEGILRFALDAGMNYLDTSPIYQSEEIIGRCIKNIDRKSLFITTKFFPRQGQTIKKDRVIDSFRKSLDQLKCGYVDCLMLQSVSSSETIKDEGFHEAIRQLKNEGKVRFCGAACHGSEVWIDTYRETMEQILGTAVEDGRYDVLLMVYNFLQRDQGARLLDSCKEKNIGTTIMKSNPVAKLDHYKKLFNVSEEKIEAMPEGTPEEKAEKEKTKKLFDRFKSFRSQSESFRQQYNLSTEDEYYQAAIKFVLSNKNVSSLLINSANYEMLETTLRQSGKTLSKTEKHSLFEYEKKMGKFYCRHACGECEAHCPNNVPVNAIMRCNHYMTVQGLVDYAKNEYSRLSVPHVEFCKDCKGYCEAVCPFHVSIRHLLCEAHGNLTIS